MRWFGWLRRRDQDIRNEPVDVEQIVAEGMRDWPSTKAAIRRLTQERKQIQRKMRVVDRKYDRLTPVKVRNIARSGPADLGPYQLYQHMRSVSDAYQDSARGDQVAELERQLQAVEAAIARLNHHARDTW